MKKTHAPKGNMPDGSSNRLVADGISGIERGNVVPCPDIAGVEDNGKQYINFQESVKNKISLLFIRHVQSRSVLHIIPSISDNKVLTQADMQYIRCASETRGEFCAAQILLDCLVLYEGWYPCLLNLLRHDEVKLPHIAEEIQKIYDNEYDRCYRPPQPEAETLTNVADESIWKPQQDALNDNLSTMTLDTDSVPYEDNEPKGHNLTGEKLEKAKRTYSLLFSQHLKFGTFLDTLSKLPAVGDNSKTLTDKKILERIASISGDKVAMDILVDFIFATDFWFPCLLQVLNELECVSLAEILQLIYNEQDADVNSTVLPCAQAPVVEVASNYSNCSQSPGIDGAQAINRTNVDEEQVQATIRFEGKLKRAIRIHFVSHVRPRSVLKVFSDIKEDFFSREDVYKIEDISRNDDESAAHNLLDCLVSYNDWYPFLVKVLRHRDVKLSHVADKLEDIHEKLFMDFCGPSENQTDDVTSVTEPLLSPVEKGKLQPRDEYKIMVNYVYLKEELDAKNLTSSLFTDNVITLDDKSEIDAAKSRGERNTLLLNLILHAGPGDAYTNFIKALKENYKHVVEILERMSYRGMETVSPSKGGVVLRQKRSKSGERGKTNSASAAVKSQNDFTSSETSKALSKMAGWYEQTSYEEVVEMLKGKSDGHYILWYWEEKKRPALFVTDRNDVKKIIMHKRTNSNKTTEYYIKQSGTRNTELQSLVKFYLKDGFYDANTKRNIVFKEPLGPVEIY